MSSFRTEKKIASALNAAVQYNLDGMSPNEAVVKAAGDKGLNPEMTCRLVEGFNIASSRAFLKSAVDKTASFPLADKESVLKTAFYEADISPEKPAAPPADFDFWGGSGRAEMKIASADKFEKHASWGDAPEAPKRSIEDLMEQVCSQKDEHHKFASDCRGSMTQAENIILRAVGDIVSSFATSGNTEKFAEFEAEAISEFGDDAADVIDMAVKHAGLGELNPPRLNISTFDKRAFAVLDWPVQLGFVERAIAARFVHKEASRKLADAERVFQEQDKTLKGFVRKLAGLEPLEGEKPKTAADMLGVPKRAGASDIIGGIADNTLPNDVPRRGDIMTGSRGAIQKEYETAAVEGFKDRRSRGLSSRDEIELDNMRRQVILQDLILNDEILSTQDPRHVAQAYNALLSINPSATLVPEVARSVLRNAIGSSALDTFTAEQMAKLEEKMRSNQNPVQPTIKR